MTTHIALVRGINVGGHQALAMADLRNLVTRLGFEDARTLLQSGNLVFRSRGARGAAALERLLEGETKKRLGLDVDFVVRSVDQWQAIVARNPFAAEAARDPGRLVVMFLKSAPAERSIDTLRGAIEGRETMHADGSHAYIYYPDGMGRSRLTGALIEKKLGTRGTARNWNTVLKVRALVGTDAKPR